MARIGKSYPRFAAGGEDPQADAPRPEKATAFTVLGALVGVLSALGLIGWLLSR